MKNVENIPLNMLKELGIDQRDSGPRFAAFIYTVNRPETVYANVESDKYVPNRCYTIDCTLFRPYRGMTSAHAS